MADPTEAIMAALFTRMASLSLTPSLPISWPNVSFSMPPDRKALRVVFVPNTATRRALGSDGAHQYLGLLQVSVHWPSGQGETAPRAIASDVADHFPPDLKLTSGGVTVRITKRPTVEDLMVGDDGVQIPVMIDWECLY